MHRYTPVRNHRPQGIKIKHVLRICILIAVCGWLIFQIKRSHYKRKDLESADTKITNSIDEVKKLGRKDLQPKVTNTGEQEDDDDDEEHENEGEKDDEIGENEQFYKFDDEEDAVNESESQTANEAREENYKADDASSEVTHEHEDQTIDYSKFLERGVSEHKNQEMGPELAYKVNISSDYGQYKSVSTRVVKESETSLKSTNMSAVVEPQTILADEDSEELDEVQHDAIDSTDVMQLEDLEPVRDGEDPVAE